MPSGLDAIGRRGFIGRLAGALFCVGAVASLLTNAILGSDVPTAAHWANALAFGSGLVCFLVPWTRVPLRWFHLIPVVAAVEVALSMWAIGVHGDVHAWYFVLIVVFVAVLFESRAAILAHTLLISALLFAPVFYEAASPDALETALVAAPVLWCVSLIVAGLREGLGRREAGLAALARCDPLTGAGNLRLLEERLEYELARHRRAGRTLAMLQLDLDCFKEVNDTLGHLAGDDLLRDVAAVLAREAREGDTVVRQGGDEFCVLAPETGALEAAALAGRIQLALHRLNAVDNPLRASIGVAVFPADGASAGALRGAVDERQRADKARHRAVAPAREQRREHATMLSS